MENEQAAKAEIAEEETSSTQLPLPSPDFATQTDKLHRQDKGVQLSSLKAKTQKLSKGTRYSLVISDLVGCEGGI